MEKRKNKISELIEKILLVLILAMILSNGNKISIFSTKLKITILILSLVLLIFNKKIKLKYIFMGWVIFIIINALSLTYTIDLKEGQILLLTISYAVPLIQYNFNKKYMMIFFEVFENIVLFGAITIIISKFWNDFPLVFCNKIFIENAVIAIKSETKGNAFSGIFATNGNAAFLTAIAIDIAGCKYTIKKQKKEIIYLIIYTIALILTNKRALLLIPFISLFIVIKTNKKEKITVKKFMIAFVSIILIIAFYNNLTNIAVFKRFSTDDDNRRGDFRKYCIEMFNDKPILGYGLGSFNKYITDDGYRVYSETNPSGIWIYHAHNVFLQVLAETGIIGLGIYLCLVIAPIKKYFDYMKNNEKEKNDQTNINIAIAIQLTFLIYCLTGNPLYMKEQIIVYLLSVSFFYSVINNKVQEEKIDKV